MAYDIPVAALVFDHQAAAALIGEPSDYFDNERMDRYDGLERLMKLTGLPVENFSSEDQSIYYIGLAVFSDFRIDIDAALISKAAALKAKYPHPLVESSQLAVVSQFN